MDKQVPVIFEGEMIVPFSHLSPIELTFFMRMLGEHDITCVNLLFKIEEKAIPYAIYAYWANYLQLINNLSNPMQEV
jgi:hypothetical protein